MLVLRAAHRGRSPSTASSRCPARAAAARPSRRSSPTSSTSEPAAALPRRAGLGAVPGRAAGLAEAHRRSAACPGVSSRAGHPLAREGVESPAHAACSPCSTRSWARAEGARVFAPPRAPAGGDAEQPAARDTLERIAEHGAPELYTARPGARRRHRPRPGRPDRRGPGRLPRDPRRPLACPIAGASSSQPAAVVRRVLIAHSLAVLDQRAAARDPLRRRALRRVAGALRSAHARARPRSSARSTAAGPRGGARGGRDGQAHTRRAAWPPHAGRRTSASSTPPATPRR